MAWRWPGFRKPPPLPPRPVASRDMISKPTVEDEPELIENEPRLAGDEPKTLENESKPTEDKSKPVESESRPMENEAKPTDNESAPIENDTKTIDNESKPTVRDDRDEDSDTETIFTENTTTAATSFWDHTAARDAVPWAGQTFVIVDKASGRVISQTNGELRLEDNTARKGCWHWLCVEKDGWLGFCNTASGRYLGINVWGVLQAEVRHHQGWEYFSARKHPNGGYMLLSTQTFWKLLTVGLNKDGILVANAPASIEGIVWEFVKV